jgi:hypothetical protein
MKGIILIIAILIYTLPANAQVTEEYMAASPCLIFPVKHARLSDSLLKNPVTEVEEIFIRGYFRDMFLGLRADLTPGIPDEAKFYPSTAPQYQQRRYSVRVMLPDSVAEPTPMMLVKISRWPEEKPLPGFFLIEKEGNHFIRGRWPDYKDTISIDLYDSLYYFDRYSLVYYANWGKYLGGEQYAISGNIEYNTGRKDTEWDKYICDRDWILYARLVMYGVKEVPKYTGFGRADGDTHDYWYRTAQASEIGENNILVRTIRHEEKFNYDVIFYTNDKKFTLDDNPENIYEIIFRTRELNTQTQFINPRKYEDLQPLRKFIFSMKEYHGRYLTYYISSYIRDTYNISISFSDLNGINFFNGNEFYFVERDKKDVVESEEIVEEPIDEIPIIEPIIKR